MRKMRMKITAGLGSVEEYERFCEGAGADEFFSGYVPYEWAKRNMGQLCRLTEERVLAYNVQIGSFSEMEIAFYYGKKNMAGRYI